MSKNHLLDFKNLKNNTSQHDALKITSFVKNFVSIFFYYFHREKFKIKLSCIY